MENNPTQSVVTLPMKIERWVSTKAEIAEAEEKMTALKRKKTAQELDIMETMKDQGTTQTKDNNGLVVFLKEARVYAEIKADKRAEAIKWLKRNLKLGYLFKENISSSQLGRVIKERLAKNLPVPEEFVKYYLKEELGYRSGTASAD